MSAEKSGYESPFPEAGKPCEETQGWLWLCIFLKVEISPNSINLQHFQMFPDHKKFIGLLKS